MTLSCLQYKMVSNPKLETCWFIIPPCLCALVKSFMGSQRSLSGKRWKICNASEDMWPIYILYLFGQHRKKTNSLKPYNIGMPVGSIGSHFVPFSGEFLLVLIFLPFVVDKEWYTLLCNYFLMKLGLCCQVQERLKYQPKARSGLGQSGIHQKHLFC